MQSRWLLPSLRVMKRTRLYSRVAEGAAFSQLSPAEEAFSLSLAAPSYTPTAPDVEAAVEVLSSLWADGAVPARSYRPVHLLLRALLKYPTWVVPQLPSGRVLKLAGPPVTLPAFSSQEKMASWVAGFEASKEGPNIDFSKHFRTMTGQAIVSLVWGDAFLRGENFRLEESVIWNPNSLVPSQTLSYPGSQFAFHLWDFAISIPTELALSQGPQALQADPISLLTYPYYLLACNGVLDVDPATKRLHIYTATDLALDGRRRFAKLIGQPESAITVQRISLPNIDASLRAEENQDRGALRVVGVSIVHAHAENPDLQEHLDLTAEELQVLIESAIEA
ncbi:MAG: hypothetical protein Q8P67_22400 [archaeon]|nr:hypothetical protein [archaeon]